MLLFNINKQNNQINQIQWNQVKAIIFDVDGTLYHQKKLRFLMILEMLFYYLIHPWKFQEIKILLDFRKEREKRALDSVIDLENTQYDWGAQKSGVSPQKVRQVVQKWIFERPLKYLNFCRYSGIRGLYEHLSRKGIVTAIFSDYPATEKLVKLGISANCIVSATDKNIDCLKPNPKGLFFIAETLKIPVENCLFIGDRNDRDAECAKLAGMPYLILEKKKTHYFFWEILSKI